MPLHALQFLISKFPIPTFHIPSLNPGEDSGLWHSRVLHPALVVLPLLWQCLDPGLGMEGAIAVGNDPVPFHLLIPDFFLLHPADPNGAGVESVHLAGQRENPRSTFLNT